MLIEGTQSALKNAVDVGVPSRSSSLSSSSPESPGAQHSGTQKGGETASNTADPFAGADVILLSEAADSVKGSVLTSKEGPDQADLARQTNSNTDAEKAKADEANRLDQFKQEANQKLNESLALRFRHDEETGTDIFQLVEQDTGDVVRQIPPDDVLDFMKKFGESVSGLLFSKQA
jgi:flagellar protein FlaG